MLHSRSSDQARFRRVLSDSERRARNPVVRVENQLLDKQLKMLERDRQRMDKLHNRRKLELTFELAERKKDVAFVRPGAALKATEGYAGQLPPVRQRKLSLPLDMIPIGCDVVDNWTDVESRLPTRGSPSRERRPGGEDDFRSVDFRSVWSPEASESSESSSGTSSRRGSRIPEFEMTPADVKIRFMRRYSVNYVENRMAPPENRQTELRPPTARSRLLLRRQSLPSDLSHPSTRNNSVCSAKGDRGCVDDVRFSNLMNALTERFDAQSLANAKKESRRRDSMAQPDPPPPPPSGETHKQARAKPQLLAKKTRSLSIF